MLDVSLGLERVECEVHADAHKPGIHPLFHFIICRILENKLCEHKLSPNKQGNIYETFPRKPAPNNSTTKQGLKLQFETSQKRTLISLAQIMSYLQANHLWPGGESTMILDSDYKYMI